MANKNQLFCFTYAGGNATFFNDISDDLPEYEVIPFEYSGHGKRYKEPFYSSFSELAEELYSQLKQTYSGGEYALFGYSMGTISLIEVLKRILANNEIASPKHVFLAAHEPLTRIDFYNADPEKTDLHIKNRTIAFGTVPDKLINNRSFWRLYLPLFRADYSLIAQYRFEELSLVTEIPATIFYSDTDTPLQDMQLWKDYFIGECDLFRFTGNHFFIQQHHNEMADIIRNRWAGDKNDI